MAQPPMTYRPHFDEDDEAPPPYEATAPETPVPPATSAPTSTSHQNPNYPAQNIVHNTSPSLYTPQNNGPLYPQRPPLGYYPAMTTAPVPVAAASPMFTAPYVLYSPYQQQQPQYAHYPQYPQYPIYPASQAYPAMPSPPANSPLPLGYPSATALPSLQPTAPLSPVGNHPLDVTWPNLEHEQSHSSAATVVPDRNLIDLDEWTGQKGTTASTPMPAEGAVSTTSPVMAPTSSPLSPLPPATMPTPASPTVPPSSATTTEVPGLVTLYRCRKCGATLESETAVCKRIHAISLNLAEKQVRQATTADMEDRQRAYNGLTSGAAAAGSGTGLSSSASFSSSSSSLSHSPRNGATSNGRRSEDMYLSPSRGSNSGGTIAVSPSQPYPSTMVLGTAENNHGTNDVYLRRSISVQNPVTTLKKLWRDAKKEMKYQSSMDQRYEFVAPPPLQQQTTTTIIVPPPVPAPVSVDGTRPGLGRSNTFYTPAYNPAHAPQQMIPSPPAQQQPHLAPSAPPRNPRLASWDDE
ncbi:hypothetical protein BGX28_007170 [Mortierella sp. GBA30]|nr:hypothetical protein BGX28_007170 [Mortierella sp. GBA30]